MRDKKFDKLFKEEFNNKYQHNLTIDLYKDELKPTKRFNINQYWKYSSICSTCLLIISLVFIGILLMKLNPDNNSINFEFKTITFTEDNNILTNEEIDGMSITADGGFYKDNAKYLNIDESLTMYVYKGTKIKSIDSGVKSVYVYFYVFDFKESSQNIILNVGEKEIVVNKDNRYGILGMLEKDLDQEIYFTLSYYGNSNNYLYK